MKKYFIIAIIIALFITGCQAGSAPPADSSQEGNTDMHEDNSAPDLVSGLVKDQYAGLDFSVNVLERMAILPGNPFQATVLVENNGDKTVSYVQGSGTFETPEALFIYSELMQRVKPSDQLGINTMDFVTKELKPGESLQLKLNVLAIEPNPDFDLYTFELHDEGTYITDVDWADLKDRFPSLVALAPGSYTLNAYFFYSVPDENGDIDPFGGPTGYAKASTIIGIS